MTIKPDGTVAQPTLNNPPVPTTPVTTPAKIHKREQREFIQILSSDHNYDIVAEIITHMQEIKRAKKIKPLEKHRLLKDYNLTLLSYCLPKIKVVETDSGGGTGSGVIFNIQIGGSGDSDGPGDAGNGRVTKGKKGVSVSIPTKKNKDGTYTVSDG
jgi:hypothetical protein